MLRYVDCELAIKNFSIAMLNSLRKDYPELFILWKIKPSLLLRLWIIFQILFFLTATIFFKGLIHYESIINIIVLFVTTVFSFGTSTTGNILIDRKKIILNLYDSSDKSIWIEYFIFKNLTSVIFLLSVNLALMINLKVSFILGTTIFILSFGLSFVLNYKLVRLMLWRKYLKKHNILLWLGVTVPFFLSYGALIFNQLNWLNKKSELKLLSLSLLIVIFTIFVIILQDLKNLSILDVLKLVDEVLFENKSFKNKKRQLSISKNMSCIKMYFLVDLIAILQPESKNYWAKLIFGYVLITISLITTMLVAGKIITDSVMAYLAVIAFYNISIVVVQQCGVSSMGNLVYMLNSSKILRIIIFEKTIIFLMFLLPLSIEILGISLMANVKVETMLFIVLVCMILSVVSFLTLDLILYKNRTFKDNSTINYQLLIYSSIVYFMLISLIFSFVNLLIMKILVLGNLLIGLVKLSSVLSKIKAYPGEKV